MKGTYVYDAFGRRVKKVGDGVTQVFFYGPDGQKVEEVYPRRPLFTTDYARRYVHVDGELMAVVSQKGPSAPPLGRR